MGKTTSSDSHSQSLAFVFEEEGQRYPLQYDTLRLALKRLMHAIGVDPTEVSSHSLRRGCATYAYHAGVKEPLLQAHGGWASDAYKAYIELTPAARIQASSLMFEHMDSMTPFVSYPAVDPLDHVQAPALQNQRIPPVEALGEPIVSGFDSDMMQWLLILSQQNTGDM